MSKIRRDCPTTSDLNDEYCQHECQTLFTDYQDRNFGNVRWLDRHTLQCPKNHAMTRHQLLRDPNDASRVRYVYHCCRVADEVVAILTEEYTGWTWHPNGAWTAHYLDRQSVSCPANSLMRMWKLDTTTSNLRLIKMCYAKFNISAAT